MDRNDWYRRTLAETAALLLERTGRRSVARTHLSTVLDRLQAGSHPDRDTRRKLQQWSRRYRPQSADDRLADLVRTLVAADSLLESLEQQGCSPTTPVLRNVARMAHVAGLREPVVEALAPGRLSFAEAVHVAGAVTV